MPKTFQVSIEAERFIHNDLSNCAHTFREVMRRKFASGETNAVLHDMLAALIFTAFSIEAKVNFVGWKVLQDGWPERASLREKIELLNVFLDLKLLWGQRPLQTIAKLQKLRDTLAHGKPEIINKTIVVNVEPDVWDALRSQWETTVNRAFVERCHLDEKTFWKKLLEIAAIPLNDTITIGGHSLSELPPS